MDLKHRQQVPGDAPEGCGPSSGSPRRTALAWRQKAAEHSCRSQLSCICLDPVTWEHVIHTIRLCPAQLQSLTWLCFAIEAPSTQCHDA